MFLVDSHCHLNLLDLEPFGGELDGALQSAHENGVGHMLCVSIDLENFPTVLAAARRYASVSASVGVHPNQTEGEDPDAARLVQLADDENVVAIGETGLDYFRNEGDMEWQRERLRQHICAAKQCNKPLIIHMRDAAEDTLQILKEEDAQQAGGVMHCFVEDWQTAKAAMGMNFYISFSGIVTFKSATVLQQVAKKMPLDRMLVETDSPYLAPVPFRGKKNQPAYVRHVAEYIAELRNESFEQIAQATTDNYFNLFKADQPETRN